MKHYSVCIVEGCGRPHQARDRVLDLYWDRLQATELEGARRSAILGEDIHKTPDRALWQVLELDAIRRHLDRIALALEGGR